MSLLRILLNRIKVIVDPIKYYRNAGVAIGEGCSIAGNVDLGSEPYLITIGNNVRLSAHVRLITHDGGLWVVRNLCKEYENTDLFGKIVIGNNVHIGINTIIMPRVTIGNNVIVGCGAVVTRDIPDNSVAVGVPARVIESVDEYIEKHKEEYWYIHDKSMKEKRQALTKKNEDI